MVVSTWSPPVMASQGWPICAILPCRSMQSAASARSSRKKNRFGQPRSFQERVKEGGDWKTWGGAPPQPASPSRKAAFDRLLHRATTRSFTLLFWKHQSQFASRPSIPERANLLLFTPDDFFRCSKNLITGHVPPIQVRWDYGRDGIVRVMLNICTGPYSALCGLRVRERVVFQSVLAAPLVVQK